MECALDWVSKGNIDGYMTRHRHDKNIIELKKYFSSVIDWVSSVFTDVESEMRGLEWGRLYEAYHKKAYDPSKTSKEVRKLYGDPYIKKAMLKEECLVGGVICAGVLHTLFNFFILQDSGVGIFIVFGTIWTLIVALIIILERVKVIKQN